MKLVVVDYGAGNLASVVNALERIGAPVVVSRDPAELATANGVIVPGVGAAADTMRHLTELGLVASLEAAVARGTPFLGICMGLQVLLEVSYEGGKHRCLGIVPGTVRRLPDEVTVPHMGWNEVWLRRPHPLFAGIPNGTDFYFVHSFYADPADEDWILGETEYGVRFASVLARDNVMATQFHPEKSGSWGLRVLENFVAIVERTARAAALEANA
ncbi:MAG: imidazole glycerol phosphate synthase subunit HisH [Thermomicrobium sp.]|nr:imidazole glycerol phosphate synthase subunit HisH [Thermomicrobium sp.]MDW8060113.1 imidazole glycerol phosphate synthase subunit HisH [Thermomicrobium sp.]